MHLGDFHASDALAKGRNEAASGLWAQRPEGDSSAFGFKHGKGCSVRELMSFPDFLGDQQTPVGGHFNYGHVVILAENRVPSSPLCPCEAERGFAAEIEDGSFGRR
jgi:hypothetical protein